MIDLDRLMGLAEYTARQKVGIEMCLPDFEKSPEMSEDPGSSLLFHKVHTKSGKNQNSIVSETKRYSHHVFSPQLYETPVWGWLATYRTDCIACVLEDINFCTYMLKVSLI